MERMKGDMQIMNIRDYMRQPGEQPLDRILPDGGLAGIFRTIACVGDSLSSGEFETLDGKGGKGYHDLFEYSWGQYMARALGSTVYNFSRGGMTAREYMEGWAEANGCWDPAKASQAYIIAMGCNDVSVALREGTDLGSMEDVKPRWQDNAKTFAGYYAQMIQRYKELQPDAKFFLMTMPRTPADAPDRLAMREEHARLMYEMAARFPNTHVLDLRRYGPVYDEEFHENFFLNGHLNPAGYLLTAQMTMSYIDYLIRQNPADFREVGLIGTPFVNVKD